MALTYNVFQPLNSVDFLNKHIYTKHPRTEPLVTHAGILRFLSFSFLAFGLYLQTTVPEKLSDEEKTPSLTQLFKLFPKFFKNRGIRLFLIYLFVSKMTPSLVNEGVSLKFIQFGVEKTSLVNIGTILLPL
jgi:hypothetical protein